MLGGVKLFDCYIRIFEYQYKKILKLSIYQYTVATLADIKY